MCDCMQKMTEKLNDKFPEWKGKPVERFEASEGAIDFESGTMVYGIGFDVKIKGQKKKEHTFVKNSFCPICGEKVVNKSVVEDQAA